LCWRERAWRGPSYWGILTTSHAEPAPAGLPIVTLPTKNGADSWAMNGIGGHVRARMRKKDLTNNLGVAQLGVTADRKAQDICPLCPSGLLARPLLLFGAASIQKSL